MIQPQTLTEQLMFATIRIETTLSAGGMGVGTAFFFNFNVDEQKRMPAIVTNKHVVSGATTGKFKVHLADQQAQYQLPSDQSEYITLDNFEQRFFMHPDPDVDLCAMPFKPLQDKAQQQGKVSYQSVLGESLIPTQAQLDDLSAVEDILMIGYPDGLWDEINNFPIFRKGITATHPAVDHNGQSTTVIDAACFPGSSGSPVLLYDNGYYTDKRGNMTLGGNRRMLLGVLYAGPQVTAQGEVIVQDIPTTRVPMAVTPMMMHLGYIVKSKEIITLGNAMMDAFRQSGLLT